MSFLCALLLAFFLLFFSFHIPLTYTLAAGRHVKGQPFYRGVNDPHLTPELFVFVLTMVLQAT